MNGHQYQCQLINLETSGGSISVSTLTSEPATLTVEQTGTCSIIIQDSIAMHNYFNLPVMYTAWNILCVIL